MLNTCCIRENADNRLYGNLGQLKAWKAQRDDRQIVVSGCLAQKDRELVRQKAAHVDVVMGTHNVHRAAELLRTARADGPITEILDAAVLDDHAMFPSALPAVRESSFNAWVTIQIGCDNHCAFCIVPAVRGVEISRPFEQIVAEIEELAAAGVTEVTLLGQNVNSYGRDLQMAARRAGDATVKVRPLFADLLRAAGAVEGIRRVRFTSPHPKDMRHGDVRRDGGDLGRLRAPALPAAGRVPTGCSPRCTAATRPSATSTGSAEARRVVPDLAVSTDIIVGFPGETDRDFAQTLEVAASARFDDAYTFIFSPRPGTEAAALTDRFVDPGRGRRAVRAAPGRRRAQRPRRQPGPDRPGRGGARRGPEPEGSRRRVGADPPAPAGALPAARSLRPGTYAAVEITGAAPHHLTGRFVELLAEPAHKARIPVAAL